MKIHIIPQFGDIIVSTGVPTEVTQSWSRYELRVITHYQVPDHQMASRTWCYGLVELDTFDTDWMTGRVWTISLLAPLWRLVRRIKSATK